MEIAKSVNGVSLSTLTPPHSCRILIGSELGDRFAGTGEKVKGGDACYIASTGRALKTVLDSANSVAAVNDVQTMYCTLSPSESITGGNYVIGFRGKYTTMIPYSANAATVDAALEALSTIGSGNIAVTGTFPNFVFTFGGTLAGAPMDLLDIQQQGMTTSDGYNNVSLQAIHTTPGKPAGTGLQQASSKFRGIATIDTQRGRAITLYHGVEFAYSDGLLVPGKDVYLSSTVPGGLADAPTLTGQKAVGFCTTTSHIFIFGLSGY